jgi:hypothetical protein
MLALVVACAFAPVARVARVARAAPRVEPPADASEIVIRLSDGFGEAGGDPRIVLEIFGDGRAVVTRPDFVVGSAHAETRLGRSELGDLLASMAAHGVLDFDPAAALEELKAADARRAEQARAHPGEAGLTAWTDPDPTTLEVRARGLVRVVSWTGLRFDAARHPEIASLRGLFEAQEELRAIVRRKDLR